MFSCKQDINPAQKFNLSKKQKQNGLTLLIKKISWKTNLNYNTLNSLRKKFWRARDQGDPVNISCYQGPGVLCWLFSWLADFTKLDIAIFDDRKLSRKTNLNYADYAKLD